MKNIPTVSRIVGAFTVQSNNIMQIDKVIDYFLNKLEIVFYSHRVQYPRALSAQVLPKELKDKVIDSTGAGDAFNAGLAVALIEEMNIK